MIAVIFEFTLAPDKFVSLQFWRGQAPADSVAAHG